MAHRWDRYSIRFPDHGRTLVAGYRSAHGERLAAAVAAARGDGADRGAGRRADADER